MGSCYIKDVLDVARGEIGYHEGSGNYNKYGKELSAVGYFNGDKTYVAWCSSFLNWCITTACIPEDRPLSEKKWDGLYFTYEPSRDNCACGVPYWRDYFKANGAFYSNPEVGDIAFYGTSHVGIVESIDGSHFYAIEGNHNDSVERVYRSMSEVSGFGRPRYDGYEPDPGPTPTPKEKYEGPWVEFPIDGRYYIQRYDEGEQVIRLQKFLVWLLGEDCLPVYGIDGEVGDEVLSAVRAAQSVLGVTVDSFYGVKTQAAAQNFER